MRLTKLGMLTGRLPHKFPPSAIWWGCFPVKILALEGLHEAAEQNAWSKIKPFFPKRSILGVLTTLSPKIPACFDQSSATIKSMLGFLVEFCPQTFNAVRMKNKKMSDFLIIG